MQALQQENRKQSRQPNRGGVGEGGGWGGGSVATMLELHKKLSAWLGILIIETR